VALSAPEQTTKRSQGGGGHTHTAEETAPGRATRLGWPGQVRGALRGRSDRAARGDVVLAQAALGHTGSRRRYTPVADEVLVGALDSGRLSRVVLCIKCKGLCTT